MKRLLLASCLTLSAFSANAAQLLVNVGAPTEKAVELINTLVHQTIQPILNETKSKEIAVYNTTIFDFNQKTGVCKFSVTSTIGTSSKQGVFISQIYAPVVANVFERVAESPDQCVDALISGIDSNASQLREFLKRNSKSL